MRTLRYALPVLACLLARAELQSQAAPPARKPWRPTWVLGAEVNYDNNVFLLSESRKADLASPSAGQVTSGRFADMEKAGDMVGDFALGVQFKGTGVTGRPLTIDPSVEYSRYLSNTARSAFEFGLGMTQDLPHQGRFRLSATLAPDQFSRNYLSDAVDGNIDGVISSGERRYTAGRSTEMDLGADYRHRLGKRSGFWVLVGAGYSLRRFDAPHEDRDLDGPTGALEVQYDRGDRVEASLRYDIAGLSADVLDRVVLVDEPAFGQDLNGDADAVDNNVRLVTPVDRSRTEQSLGAEVDLRVARGAHLGVAFTHRWRSFSSTEQYDVTDRGRRDRREEVGVSLSNRLGRRTRLRTRAEYATQRLSRDLDSAGNGEISDYSKLRLSVGITCECLRQRRAPGGEP